MTKFIQKVLCAYVLWLLLFFVGETFLLHGLGLENYQWLFWLLRDGLWWLLVGYMIVRYASCLRAFIQKYFWLLFCLVGLGLWSLFLSWTYDMTFFERFVGFKYDRYYLLILMSGLFVGAIFARHHTSGDSLGLFNSTTRTFLSGMVYFVVLVLGASVVWQLLKVWQPSVFLEYLGYGGFGDFVPGEAPPLYYKTGAGGIMRLSGLFAGPNVLGFFLVVVVPFLFLGAKHMRKRTYVRGNLHKLMIFLVWVLWGGCLLLTFSRGAYIAGLIGLLGSIWFLSGSVNKKILKKSLLSLLLIVCFGALTWGVNYLKSGSNQERGSGNTVARDMVQEHAWGYGPGTAGHARHYWADYSDHQKHSLSLVENIYLQLGVNLGLPGVLLYCLFWFLLLLKVLFRIRTKENSQEGSSQLLIACIIALLALSVEGLVLHVWRDSQFNFLFLIFVGMVMGYYMTEPKKSLC